MGSLCIAVKHSGGEGRCAGFLCGVCVFNAPALLQAPLFVCIAVHHASKRETNLEPFPSRQEVQVKHLALLPADVLGNPLKKAFWACPVLM